VRREMSVAGGLPLSPYGAKELRRELQDGQRAGKNR
jgi:hypothetical protein